MDTSPKKMRLSDIIAFEVAAWIATVVFVSFYFSLAFIITLIVLTFWDALIYFVSWI